MKTESIKKSSKAFMHYKIKPHVRHYVQTSVVPHSLDRGIHFSDQCEHKSFIKNDDSLIDWIVGAGYLFEQESDFPFRTFCRNDARALKSDWDVSGSDFARALFSILDGRDEKFRREFYGQLIKLLRNQRPQNPQLSLPLDEEISNGRRRKESID